MPDPWRRVTVEGVELLRCEPLLACGLTHAFSTRRADGGTTFDLAGSARGAATGGEPTRRFLAAAGFRGSTAVALRQVHGQGVVRARDAAPGHEADAAIWVAGDPPDPVPAVRTADCVPILIVERSGRAAAAVHAGWRGTAAAIAAEVVRHLAALGVEPGQLLAAVGPAIGVCCYEVGPEVARAVGHVSTAGGRTRVDLREANREQLERAGLAPGAIQLSADCTACATGRYFSHRAEGPGTGRMLAAVGP